jgi:hypothetical protein
MSETADEPVVLRAPESSVLVHGTALAERPTIDATERLGDGRVITVDVRFGRLPAGYAADEDTVLVGPTEPPGFEGRSYDAVSAPDSLTEYGVALTRVIDGADAPLRVEVDSLTALLQHAAVDSAFRFVHVLSGRVDREAAVLIATIDPGAHDEQTVATMTQPFDVAVTGDPGDRRVRRR